MSSSQFTPWEKMDLLEKLMANEKVEQEREDERRRAMQEEGTGKPQVSQRKSWIEDWDDDNDFLLDGDDLTFRGNSTSAHAHSHHRDSHSSFRSDRESLPGNDERHLHLPGDDEKSTLDAIAAAAHAGIPIPTNVPPSALVGGTIKRLGGRKTKKIFQEDYGDDLELPISGPLRLKPQDGKVYPESLRQMSMSSPTKQQAPTIAREPLGRILTKSLVAPINLEKFRDDDDDDDVFGDGAETIKVSKIRPQSRPISLITPPTPSPQKGRGDDDFEGDLELPSNGLLKLSRRMDIPRTPALNTNDDFDWGEGSLGTRFGGTKRDAFSTRSSSVSAMSPSLASSITAESEDEIFDGLLLPNGPLDLNERLKRRKQDQSPERRPEHPMSEKRAPASKNIVKPTADNEDPLDGLEFGDGDVFRSDKPTLHRNVKVKEARPVSPTRPKTAVSVTFTNRPVTSTPVSRLPRPMASHERAQTQPSLEPVSESGGPIPPRPSRRSQSRLGHSSQSSISSVHTPNTPSSVQSVQFSTPRRRELSQKTSIGALRNEPTTTSAQLLRLKRSLPAMRHTPVPAKPTSRFDRPPSRTDSRVESGRPQSVLRPKTPVDRTRPAYESSAAQARKNPFLPAGASQSQSQHVSTKGMQSTRPFRRHDSDQGPELRPLSRAISRTAARSPSPRRARNDKMSAEPVWQQISKPRRVRRFGDGHELDSFDDLPTSAQAESKYVKQPVACGNRTNIRNKLYQNVLPERSTPSPVSPFSPARPDSQPHFARDTAASRIARETSLAQRAPTTGPLLPVTNQRVAQLSARGPFGLHSYNSRAKKSQKIPQLKPHLISNLNSAKETKGMPTTPKKPQKSQQPKTPQQHQKLQVHRGTQIPRTPKRSQTLQQPETPKRPMSRIPLTLERLQRLQKPQTPPQSPTPQKLVRFGKSQPVRKPEASFQTQTSLKTPSIQKSKVPLENQTTQQSKRFRRASPAKNTPISQKPQSPVKSQKAKTHEKPRHSPQFQQPMKSQALHRPYTPHTYRHSQRTQANLQTSVVNGMTYNPATFRWEGNDNALTAFDVPTSSPTTSLPPHTTREREGSTSRPVLITNMTATKGVKRVGDMVFDPQNMCWLKVDTTPSLSNNSTEGFSTIEEDDPFKDIPDLDDKDKDSVSGGHGRGGDLRDDWLVGEEFDVGPEFIRRQHEEESRWRRKCGPWGNTGNRNRTDLRWTLRKMIIEQ